MSSLVYSGNACSLMLLNGGTLPVQAVLKSALTSGQLVLTSQQNETQEFPTSDGQLVTAAVQAYGGWGSSAPIWVVQANEEWQVLAEGSVPVILTPVLVSALVP